MAIEEESKRMREITFLIWLLGRAGIGNAHARTIIDRFGDAEAVYNGSAEDLLQVPYFTEKIVKNMLAEKDELNGARRIVKDCRDLGIRIIREGDPEWPCPVMKGYNPPPLLYVAGQPLPQDLKERSKAVIGTLEPTDQQKRTCLELGEKWAEEGTILIGGMDRGVSSYVQTACIRKGGTVLAVLPCSPDICYPGEHRKLYEAIRKTGTIVSEYPPITRPGIYRFRQRNNLIQALAGRTVWLGRPEDQSRGPWKKKAGPAAGGQAKMAASALS